MSAGARMGVVPIFAYRDLHRGAPALNRVPFPEAGFDVSKVPNAVALDQSFVYEAELYYVPPGGSAKEPIVLNVRKGFAHLARDDDFFVMEGEEHLFFLDAWNERRPTFHLDGLAWRHPGPPPREHFTRVRLGTGIAEIGAHPLVDLHCTRFAWWSRLEVLVETLARMAAPYQALCRQAMRVVGLANATHAFLSAMGASAPTRYTEPAFVRALEGSQRTAERILAVLDGRLSPRVVQFLQRYSNVCALVWDLFNLPELQRSLSVHGGLVPDEQRSLVVSAVHLMALVPPGYEIAPVHDPDARVPVVEKRKVAPSYAESFLRKFYYPWVEEAVRDAGEPVPEVFAAPAPPGKAVDSAKEWRGVLKVARRSAFAFVGLAKNLMRAPDVEGFLRMTPAAYRGIERMLVAAGDKEGASWATKLRVAVEDMEEAADWTLKKTRHLADAAGRVERAAADMDGLLAEDAARKAAMLEVEAHDFVTEAAGAMKKWADKIGKLDDALDKVPGLHRALDHATAADEIAYLTDRVEELDRLSAAHQAMLPARAPLGVWVMYGVDIGWSAYLLWKAGKELIDIGRGAHSATDLWRAREAILRHAKDAASALGNLTKSAGGLAELVGAAQGVTKALATVGGFITLGAAAADSYFFLSDVKKDLPREIDGLLEADRIKLVGAHAVIGTGKLVYMVGVEIALIAGITGVGLLAGALVSAIGMSLDYSGQVLAAAWRVGAAERASYDALLRALTEALDALASADDDLESKRCKGPEAASLASLGSHGELFRTIRPIHARAFGLVKP